MEIYRSQPNPTAFISVPPAVVMAVLAGAPNTVMAVDGLLPIMELPQAIPVLENSPDYKGVTGFNIPMPWQLMQVDRDFFLDFDATITENGQEVHFNEREFIQVVTRILPDVEIQRITGETDPVERNDIERRVRYAIQTFTGQNFGRFRARMNVVGTGESRLPLPQPIIAVYSSNFPLENYYVQNGGWYLRMRNESYVGIKAAPTEEQLDAYAYSGIIKTPSSNRGIFPQGVVYSFDALWGYHDIPGDVLQAARMLALDYSCDESLWRERYINSVRSGNWRFEVNDHAFAGTGNVFADQILEEYRKITLDVV